jgi:hypothetical protein
MTKSRFLNKKVVVPAVVVAVAAALVFWGLPQAIAVGMNQTINSTAPQLPRFTGSINVGQALKNFTNNNVKVSFLEAASIAAKQTTNGTIVGGHLGVVQGYLVYTFFAMNAQSKTGFLVIVDAGNGHVLYTSQGHQSIGSFGPPIFGPFGLWRAAGFGGFCHGLVGPW